jgi:hypothetical protein
VAAVSLVVLAVPAPASASNQQDLASTHALIVASDALARVGNASIPIAQAKIEQFDRKLAAECPGAGAGTPETEASQPMSSEVADALWSISYGTATRAIERFVGAVKPLHWSNGRFDRTVHAFATTLLKLATLPLPDLCTDVRLWAASRFQTVPRDVTELDQRVEALTLPEIPWKLVAPYESRHDASMLPYIERAETNLEEAEFTKGQHDWYGTLETLGLPP